MEWTEEQYGTSVEQFDEEHKELFKRVNALHQSIIEGSDIITKLDELIDYVSIHFQNEEARMLSAGYEGYESHKNSHDAFLKECSSLRDEFSQGNAEVNENTMDFIKNWLDSHIPNTDRKYGPVLGGTSEE